MSHWHITRHDGDDDVYATDSIFEALDYAATELAIIAEMEHESIRIYGKAGDYESAYKAWDASDRLNAPIANAANMAKQNGLPVDQRAPLYRDPASTDKLLRIAALSVVSEVNRNAPSGFHITQCYLDPCEAMQDDERVNDK